MQSITESTVTSANAILLLKADGVVSNWFKIVGFAPDTGWDSGDVTMGETQMGIDGRQSGGFVPFELPLTVNLTANSPSQVFFNQMIKYFLKHQETAYIEFSLSLNSIKKRYSGGGFLVTGNVIPAGGNILQTTSYTINSVLKNLEDI